MKVRFTLSIVVSGLLALSIGCAHDPAPHPKTDPAHASAIHGHDDEEAHAHVHLPRRVVPEGAGAPLFNDLGDYTMTISSDVPLARRFFAQGLVLAYGFNHAEALRSFQEASRHDPGCGICAWGEAYVLGPNINKPMDANDVPTAWTASRRALRLAGAASEVERALIEALAKRYGPEPIPDRSRLDRAYADAMRDVAGRFPEHLDVQTLFAEALMDTMPWDYWTDPDTPKSETREVLAALEGVMAREPDHPGALHFYIHAVEPSNRPELAEAAADRLGPLAPGAGHLVHMPSHIYLRVGRYHDASAANEKAASADESYITQCRAQGFYPAVYYPHNIHFLYASAAFEGRSAISIQAARKLAGAMNKEVVAEVPIAEEFMPMAMFALARFERWAEVERLSEPDPELRYVSGVWHYVQGMAHAAAGRASAAGRELVSVRHIASEPALQDLYFASGSTPAQLLTIGAHVLDARIATEAGRHVEAVAPLERAVELQDALPYTEPPPWYFPTREALGAALIASGRPAEAEQVFRKQLEKTPRNGWSLHGLARSLRAQHRFDAARHVDAAFRSAWSRADFQLDPVAAGPLARRAAEATAESESD